MRTITHMSITREQVWAACRRTPDVRLRERCHCLLLRMDGQDCPESAPWLYRDEGTMRAWGHAFNGTGLPGLQRVAIPGRPG
jgi:hypothetical protein